MNTGEIPPILRSPVEARAIVEPREFVSYFMEHLGLDHIEVGQSCVLCYSHPLADLLVERTGARETRQWIFSDRQGRGLYNFQLDGKKVSLLRVEFGASSSGTMMEILIACGARDFIAVGSAGTLQSEVEIGDLVVADKAVRDEGLSYHYLPPSGEVSAASEVVAALTEACRRNSIRHHVGATWTTDALFRETVEEVVKYRNARVLTVDMEAAALYAIARHRKARCCCLFYVTDSLCELKWHPRFFEMGARHLEASATVVLDALRLLDTGKAARSGLTH
ncbi:MAG: nucleoside phosphorylase [Chloroflexota bacterium]